MPTGIHRAGYMRPLSSSAVDFLGSMNPHGTRASTPGHLRIADCLVARGLALLDGRYLSLTVLGGFVRAAILEARK